MNINRLIDIKYFRLVISDLKPTRRSCTLLRFPSQGPKMLEPSNHSVDGQRVRDRETVNFKPTLCMLGFLQGFFCGTISTSKFSLVVTFMRNISFQLKSDFSRTFNSIVTQILHSSLAWLLILKPFASKFMNL